MGPLWQDLRYGLRSLRRNKLFAAVATLTLALAIGVNTSIFSLVNVIVFADLPMNDSETMTLIRSVNPGLGVDQGSVSLADYFDLAERNTSFEELTALTEDQWVLTGADEPIRITGYRTTANLLGTWRLPPILGRDFAAGEDLEGAPRVALLTYPFWQTRYGGETDVLGRTIQLDGVTHTIIGVTDPKLGFANFRDADVWVPLELRRDGADRQSKAFFVTGRLRPGVSHSRATQETDAIGQALADEYPDANRGWALWSAPVMESLIDDEARTILLMLVLTVTFVVLIACANIANMLLARATARARELSVRSALGAGRMRLIRQLMTESFVISLLAATLGLAFAKGLNEALVRISNGTEVVFMMAELDGRVLGFTLLVSLLAPLAFGLFPALRASGDGSSSALRDARGADGGRGGKRARSVLVGAQVSLALTLMIVAGLLVRTVYNLQTRELGFDPQGLLMAELDLPENTYPDEESRRQFYTLLLEAAEAIPTVTHAELISAVPGVGFGSGRAMDIEGRPLPEGQARPPVLAITVSEQWQELLGVPLVGGRALGPEDVPESLPVVLLSRDVADQYWPNEDPLGRRIRIGNAETAEWMQVVGVVGDVRSTSDTERPAQNVYLPYQQDSRAAMDLVIRTAGDPSAVFTAVREAVWSVDANQPIDRIRTVRQAQYDSAASTYALLTLFVSFAVFALFMAAIGIYGVMSYAVSQRQGEIGLRMALGASVGSVRQMVLGQGLRILAGGVLVGLLAAFALSRLLGNLVFGVSTSDPLTFIGVPLVLAAVATLANYIPARRATRMSPVSALRAE